MTDFGKDIDGFRSRVPVTRDWAYLITASTGLVPDFVYEGVRRYMDARYLAGGDSVWEYPDERIGTLGMIERSKRALGGMLGCAPERVCFGQSATQMFTMVTEGIDYAPDANVVTVGEGWIGNRFAWQKREAEGLEVRYAASTGGVITAEALMALCDEHTAAVTINSVESETGYRADLKKLGAFCRERGILLFVDAVQSAGALVTDFEGCNIDFLVGNDYKWMMNFCGTGYACVGERVMPLIKRWGAGWMSDTERFNTAKAHLELRSDAGRFEIGYPNAPGIYGLGLAAMQYSLLGAENVENYVRSLAEYCIQCAETTPGVRCTLDIPYERRSQIVLLSFDGSIAASDEDFRAAQVFAPGFSAPDANGERRARLSFHYYNNREDIDRFFAVIRASRG